SPEELVDFRNNIIYNWVNNSTYGGEKGRYNVVANYYKPGPATKQSKIAILNPWTPYGKFFVSENVLYGNAEVTKNNFQGVKSDHVDSALVSEPFNVEFIKEQSAEDAYEKVLIHAGASLNRDVVDERIVQDVRSGQSI